MCWLTPKLCAPGANSERLSPALSQFKPSHSDGRIPLVRVGVHAQSLQLAVERRALHADEVRRAADIAAEPGDLHRQIFPLEMLPRVAQRHGDHLKRGCAARIAAI